MAPNHIILQKPFVAT